MLARLVLGGIPLPLVACSGDPHLSFLNPQGPIAANQAAHFWLVNAILFMLVALPVFIGTV